VFNGLGEFFLENFHLFNNCRGCFDSLNLLSKSFQGNAGEVIKVLFVDHLVEGFR
jgi:hypothetical protein